MTTSLSDYPLGPPHNRCVVPMVLWGWGKDWLCSHAYGTLILCLFLILIRHHIIFLFFGCKGKVFLLFDFPYIKCNSTLCSE